MTGWTSEQIEDLKARFKTGAQCSRIAQQMGRTRNAVIGKLNRLGFIAKYRPARFLAKEGLAKEGKIPKPKSVDMNKMVPKKTEIKSAAVCAKPIHAPLEGPVPLLQLRDHHCRYPLWTAKDREGDYCGAHVVTGFPYCATHAQLCYTTKAQRAAQEKAAAASNALMKKSLGKWTTPRILD